MVNRILVRKRNERKERSCSVDERKILKNQGDRAERR